MKVHANGHRFGKSERRFMPAVAPFRSQPASVFHLLETHEDSFSVFGSHLRRGLVPVQALVNAHRVQGESGRISIVSYCSVTTSCDQSSVKHVNIKT